MKKIQKVNKIRKNMYFFLFIGLGLLVSLSVCTVMYLQFRSHIKSSYFSTLGNVAHMVEKQYPALYEKDALKRGYLNNEDWVWDMHEKWEEIVSAFGLAYIYYIEKDANGNFVFITDTYFKRDEGSGWLGTPVWSDNIVPAGVHEAWDTQQIQFSPFPSYEKDWGILVSALLPIVINGETVGLLGVDYDISFVNALERRVFTLLILSFAASVIITAFLAFFASRTVIVSIEEREKATHEANERRKEIESLMGALKATSDSRNAFLSKISREMTDPISNIIRISSLISGKEEVSKDMQQNLDLINESGTVLYDVINNIMDVLKIEAGELKINNIRYELPDLISDVTSHYTSFSNSTSSGGTVTEGTSSGGTIKEGTFTGSTSSGGISSKEEISYKLALGERLPIHLGGDVIRIRLICHHLISNAFKYTNKGAVSVSIASKWQKGFVWLVIKVSDTGIGIAENNLEHIFAGYSRLDAVEKFRKGGSGLGLYISKQLVDLMKGTLTIESELGRGSTFTLSLPQKLLSESTIDPDTKRELMCFSYPAK